MTDISTDDRNMRTVLYGPGEMLGLNNVVGRSDGTTVDRLTPVSVVNLTQVFHDLRSRLLRSFDRWRGPRWGLNRWGQVGDGTTTDRFVPVPVFD